ncbi:Acetyltransferase (GNAT) domain-containing protein [Actinopolymorpha cephalotaxi]|uniref:Acetyltransferase (GNAT) domain-containing protein n=1 Tax=Actinopolymorpha cephalotaxi TaxID=504797 RepID=A0A1I2Q5E1_9ACTN|nr:GNAT family N-acetyltransferase [Actinopolymorpha cephalotaxi]NYH83379.1 GNAT superfamily N-acetyltransferase [Actinopolymorpha cephalotaxi]SFG22589.1 Acetyltransferase (GNAT) domain-containing protein [Actinopolymorpha cephalotaxi]
MTSIVLTNDTRDLGDGLVLRWSTPEDTDALAELAGAVFRDDGDEQPNQVLMDVVRRHMRGDHPLLGPTDYVVVEDTTADRKRFVACACYQQEEWTYDGVSLPVGRPEIVAADPEHRRRGLVRKIFGVIHDRCARDGKLVQSITGIPYFYRQFGYEYAVDLGGTLSFPVSLLPEAKAGETLPYRLRKATREDVPALIACYQQGQRGSLVSSRLAEKYWSYNIDAENDPDPRRGYARVRIIESVDGEFRGLAVTQGSGAHFRVSLLEFAAGTNLAGMRPSLLRGLVELAGQQLPNAPDTEPLGRLVFELGRDHPFYPMIPAEYGPRLDPPYAWYVRVPDLPAVLRRIAPVLERRLADSAMAGYGGDLLLDFYRSSVRLTFTDGRLTDARDEGPTDRQDKSPRASFPPLVFLRSLFGHASLEELRAGYPDVGADGTAGPLVNALFPKRPSRLFAP